MGLAVDQESGVAVKAAASTCGRIVSLWGRVERIEARKIPHWGSRLQSLWDSRFPAMIADRCEIYYHLTSGAPAYLTLSYLRTSRSTRYATIHVGLLALDEVAKRLGVNAIVCHVTNQAISDRLMKRLGWQRHCLHWKGRHFIKRFYGEYPTLDPYWRSRMPGEYEQ
jgi:hypothetical protein